jgi:hypothetical protein
MMRGPVIARWIAIALLAVCFVATAVPAQAEPESPAAVNIVVFAYVDVAGSTDGSNPVAPACNLAYDTGDQDYARTNPLPSMTFVVRDPDGNELGRADTTALAELQRVRFNDVADFATYTVSLEGAPTGWTLCPQQSATNTVTQSDITLGQARLNYYFYVASGEVPTATPTATTAPGVTPSATPTRAPGVTPSATRYATPKPTLVPAATSAGGAEEEEEEGGQAPVPVSASSGTGAVVTQGGGYVFVNPPAGTGKLAMIRGVAFLDLNGDGLFGAGEPGLDHVQVYLHGGGLQISQITPPSGQFSFEALGTGEYDVFVNPGPEWRVSTAQKYVVRVRGNIVTGIDFGLARLGAQPEAVAETETEAAGTGIRLPATGVIALSRGGALGGLALALTLVGLVGLTIERRSRRTGLQR